MTKNHMKITELKKKYNNENKTQLIGSKANVRKMNYLT